MSKKTSKKLTANLTPFLIIAAVLLVGGALAYLDQKEEESNDLSVQEIGGKSITFINDTLLQGAETATLLGVSEENGLYKLSLKIGENEFDSYATKDGSLFFPEGVKMVEEEPEEVTEGQVQPTEQPKTCDEVTKAETPLLEVFVVSKCPFGTQTQRILGEIIKNIPSLAGNIDVKYIGSVRNGEVTAMHGEPEAQENLRQICIREEQADKYWNYLGCHLKKAEVDGCLTAAGVNKTELTACMTDGAGVAYAQEDFTAQGKYGVTGSPTLILNGVKVSEFNFGGRTAQSLKTLTCCGFSQSPGFCSQELSGEEATTGFSETYAPQSGASPSGSCN